MEIREIKNKTTAMSASPSSRSGLMDLFSSRSLQKLSFKENHGEILGSNVKLFFDLYLGKVHFRPCSLRSQYPAAL